MDENLQKPKEDERLIKAFQQGNRSAFDTLVLKHQQGVFNLCYRMLGDDHEANDSAQETFFKVYRSLKKFRFESAFSTWLYRVTVNTCKNRLKSSAFRQKKRTVFLNNPHRTEDNRQSMEILDNSPSPVAELERKERMKAIQAAIDTLTPERKEAVILKDIEGLSYEEIADITGQALGTVKSRLARARLDLRNKLRSFFANEL